MVNKRFDLGFVSIVPSIGYGLSYLNSASVHEVQSLANGIATVVSDIEVGGDFDTSFNRLDYGFYFNARCEHSLAHNHFVFFEPSLYYGLKDYDRVDVSKNRSLNLSFGIGYNI